jgi:hypothetical protein
MTNGQYRDRLLDTLGEASDATDAALRLLELCEPADLDAALALVPRTCPSRARAEAAIREAWASYHHLRGRSWN